MDLDKIQEVYEKSVLNINEEDEVMSDGHKIHEKEDAVVRLTDANKIIKELIDALHTAMNTEAPASIGARSGAMKGFDTKYHYNKIRKAIKMGETHLKKKR